MSLSMRVRALTAVTALAASCAAIVLFADPASALSDSAAPTLVSAHPTPAAADTTFGDVSGYNVLRVKDRDGQTPSHPGSGLDHGTMNVTVPAGAAAIAPIDFQNDMREGSTADGTIDVPFTLPQGQAPGTYSFSITMADVFGNTTAALPAGSVTVTRTADSTAPTLVGGTVAVTSATADVTHGPVDETYTAHVTDATPGVKDVVADVLPPDGTPGDSSTYQQLFFNRTAGTAQNGTWTATQSYTHDLLGQFKIVALHMTDGYGNHADPTSVGGTVTVSVNPADTTAPVLKSVTAPNTPVDVTTADAKVTVTIHVTDDISGLVGGSIEFTSPGQTSFAGVTFADTFDPSGNPSSGTRTDGTWNVPVTIPARSTPGAWTISSYSLTDAQGNEVDGFAGDGVTPSGTVFTVAAHADSVAPTITSLTITPASANAAYGGGARLIGRLTYADDFSGFQSASITFKNPAGTAVGDPNVNVSTFDEVPGSTPTAGTVVFEVTVPDAPANVGTWHVNDVTLTDLAQNSRTVTPSASFAVTSSATDTQAPTLTGLTFAPSPLSTASGDADVTATAHVNDPGAAASGFTFGTVTLTSPSGNNEVFFDLGGNPTSGDDVDGTFTNSASLAKYSEGGLWKVTRVELSDAANHTHVYLAGDLSGLSGVSTSLQVNPAVDTTAPVLTAVSVDSATLNTATSTSIAMHASATDNSSGVASIQVTLAGPGGRTATDTGYPDAPGSPVTVTMRPDVPQYNSAGQWSVSKVVVTDVAGNAKTYDSSTAPGSAHTVTVTAPTDTTPPTVTGLIVTPSPVDSSENPVAVDVLVHATDAASGLGGDATLTLTSPAAAQTRRVFLSTISGTDNDGWLQGSFTVPQYVDGGTWTVGPLVIGDAVGNTASLSSAQLTSAGLPGTVQITGKADTVKPTLTALTITSPIDARTADATGTINATATDAQSGVAAITVALSSPTGHNTRNVDLNELSPVTAGQPDNFRGTFTIPRFAESGTWTVTSVTVRDVYGNVSSYGYDQLASFTRSFTVQSTQDTTAPALTGLTLAVTTIDVSAGARTVSGTISASDAESGVAGGFLTYVGPNNTAIDQGFTVDTPAPGTTTAPFTLEIPAFVPQGDYTLSAVELYDEVGNTQTYPPTPLPGAGIATTLHVTDTNADTTAPALVGVTAPATLDVRTAAGSVTVDVHLTDAKSGVHSGTVRLTSPSGQDKRQQSFVEPTDRKSGTANDGTYEVVFPFGTATESGNWTISLDTTDAAGNSATYTGAAVLGTKQIAVQGAAVVPDAPTDVFASPGNASATVLWTQPANGGSPITGYAITPYKAGVAQPPTTVSGTATSGKATGLTNGTSYTFTVKATNAKGNGPESAQSTAVTPQPTAPGAPASATASGGNAQATVSWTAPTDNGGSPVTSYTVTTYNSATSTQVKSTSGLTGTSTTVTGLTNGTAYYFGVTAVNAVGAGGTAFTDIVTPAAAPPTAPGAPTIGTATTIAGGATVTWTAPASNGNSAITHYIVTPYLNGTTAQTPVTFGTVTSGDVTGLTKGASYTFKVAAQNAIGTGPQSAASNSVTVPTTAPGVPVIGTATAGAGGATVNWAAPADNGGTPITHYVVTPYLNGTTAQPTTTVGNVLSTTIGTLTKGASYMFTVIAQNATGSSGPSAASNSVTIATTPPGAPTIGTATASPSAQSATVTWTAPSDTGGSAITGYQVTPLLDGTTPQTATSVGNVTSATALGLLKGRSYTFTVAATNAQGTGAKSAASNSVTIATTAPDAPTAVSAVAGDKQATVSWSAPGDTGGTPITGYTVTSSPDGKTCTATTTSCTVTGLTNGTAYTFTVAATNAKGTGVASAASLPVTPQAAPPAAPTGVTATAGNAQATVSWVAAADNGSAVTGYTVTSAPGGKTCTTATTSCTVTGLTNGTAYTFTVTATNGNGTGPASTASAAVTPRAPTALAITSMPASVGYGAAAKVVGKLTSGGTAVSGVSVRLQFRHKGSTAAFSTFATAAKSSSTGVVTFSTFKPSYSVEVRLTVATGGAFTGSTSASKSVAVTRKITIASNHVSVAKGKSFVLSGAVTPNSKGKKVTLQRKSGTKWVTVTSATLGSTSKYAFTVKGTAKGTFSYRVTIAADTNYATSVSATKAVKVV